MSEREELRQQIADTIDRATVGWSINLTSLVDGVYTYTLKIDDGSEPQQFEDRDEASIALAERLRLAKADAVLALPALAGIAAATHPKDRNDGR